MRSLSAIGRVAAVGALIAALVLVSLIFFGGGGGGYKVRRASERRPVVRANPGRWAACRGSVKASRSRATARRIELSLAATTPPARGKRRDPPVLPAARNRYVPEAPAGHGRHDSGRRRHRHRQHRHPGRPRRALQHARPGNPALAPGLLPALRGSVAGHGAGGQRRLPVPEPGAVHLEPAVQRADQGHPGAGALPRGQLPHGHRSRRAP